MAECNYGMNVGCYWIKLGHLVNQFSFNSPCDTGNNYGHDHRHT